MSTIKQHLSAILMETGQLQEDHSTSTDEYIAIDDLERKVHEARKVFERTKEIDSND